MKKLASICAGLLLALSTAAFAEEHAVAALEHASSALEHGKAGHNSVLVEHAKTALDQSLAASLVTKSIVKNHIDAAADLLQKAVDEGNLDHTDAASKVLEEAIVHLKAANKK